MIHACIYGLHGFCLICKKLLGGMTNSLNHQVSIYDTWKLYWNVTLSLIFSCCHKHNFWPCQRAPFRYRTPNNLVSSSNIEILMGKLFALYSALRHLQAEVYMCKNHMQKSWETMHFVCLTRALFCNRANHWSRRLLALAIECFHLLKMGSILWDQSMLSLLWKKALGSWMWHLLIHRKLLHASISTGEGSALLEKASVGGNRRMSPANDAVDLAQSAACLQTLRQCSFGNNPCRSLRWAFQGAPRKNWLMRQGSLSCPLSPNSLSHLFVLLMKASMPLVVLWV